MIRFLSILFLGISITACNPDKYNEQIQEEFRENNFNMKLVETVKYNAISFKLPEKFNKAYNHSYTVKGNSLTRESYALGIKFSVETFSQKDFNKTFIKESGFHEDNLNTLHDAYVDRRYYSLDNAGATFKKTINKKKVFKGIIQVVSGEDEYSDDFVYYATATLKIGTEYYVFQWISRQEMMSYVMDDFERILYTVKKIK